MNRDTCGTCGAPAELCNCHAFIRGQKLRDAAQAVCDRWDTPNWAHDAPHTGELIAALRKALREDALELLSETHRQLEHFSERGTVGTALAIAAAVQAEREACAAIARETSFLVGHRILERGRQ